MKKAIFGLSTIAAIGLAGYAYAAQPHMEAALKKLDEAKAELQAATDDKGGHKMKAIEAVNQAMTQVAKSIEFDASHPQGAHEGSHGQAQPASAPM